MAKKSPIKNLVSSMTGAHRSTLSHLIDSASNAVQQGAQHVVASSSLSSANKRKQPPRDNKQTAAPVAKEGEDYLSWTNMKRPQHDVERKAVRAIGPKSRSGGGGVRVREAIHMFDTAATATSSKNTEDKEKSASPSKNMPSVNRDADSFCHSSHRKHRGVAVKTDDEIMERRTHSGMNHYPHNDDDGINAAKSALHHHSDSNQYYEKENESNNLKNIENDRHQLSMKKDARVDTLSRPTAVNECEYETRAMVNSLANKCSSSVVKRGSSRRQGCMEADMQNGRGAGAHNDDAVHSPEQRVKTTATKKREPLSVRGDEATSLPVARVLADATTTANKNKHPLIQSPLRKHIKIVHDSACANASCTVIKEPFPLLLLPPPPHQRQHQQLKEWTSDHLYTLDVLTTTTTSIPRTIGVTGYENTTMKKDENPKVEEGDHNDCRQGCSNSSSRKEEEAIDLLTSASFLFQQSRRKLG